MFFVVLLGPLGARPMAQALRLPFEYLSIYILHTQCNYILCVCNIRGEGAFVYCQSSYLRKESCIYYLCDAEHQ